MNDLIKSKFNTNNVENNANILKIFNSLANRRQTSDLSIIREYLPSTSAGLSTQTLATGPNKWAPERLEPGKEFSRSVISMTRNKMCDR